MGCATQAHHLENPKSRGKRRQGKANERTLGKSDTKRVRKKKANYFKNETELYREKKKKGGKNTTQKWVRYLQYQNICFFVLLFLGVSKY